MLRKLTKGIRVAREPRFWRALRHGVAASIEHDAIPLPSDIAHVIDVGANRGQFLTWASVRFPDAVFDCFEPFELPRRTLEQVVPEGRTVTIHEVALGEQDGSRKFNVTKADDSSSLLLPTELQLSTFPESEVVDTVSVVVRRLDEELSDSAIRRPSLLKIDVQGSETQVLAGASRILAAVDLVVIECSFAELYVGQSMAADVFSLMVENGFQLAGCYSPSISGTGRLIQADALFKRLG